MLVVPRWNQSHSCAWGIGLSSTNHTGGLWKSRLHDLPEASRGLAGVHTLRSPANTTIPWLNYYKFGHFLFLFLYMFLIIVLPNWTTRPTLQGLNIFLHSHLYKYSVMNLMDNSFIISYYHRKLTRIEHFFSISFIQVFSHKLDGQSFHHIILS